jgi:hypothetical protein
VLAAAGAPVGVLWQVLGPVGEGAPARTVSVAREERVARVPLDRRIVDVSWED